MLNTNADTIAGETAKALSGLFDVTLVYCFEKKGVLRDENDDDSVIPQITRADYFFLNYFLIRVPSLPLIADAKVIITSDTPAFIASKEFSSFGIIPP